MNVYSQDTVSSPVDSLIDVGVVKDDVGALSTEFEGDVLQVGLGGSLHDFATDKGRAGEGDLAEIRKM